MAVIVAVDLLDSATVRLTLGRPNAALPAALAGGAGYVLNPAACSRWAPAWRAI